VVWVEEKLQREGETASNLSSSIERVNIRGGRELVIEEREIIPLRLQMESRGAP
jgi:hypothetical protein